MSHPINTIICEDLMELFPAMSEQEIAQVEKLVDEGELEQAVELANYITKQVAMKEMREIVKNNE